jgi:hypothetical protein
MASLIIMSPPVSDMMIGVLPLENKVGPSSTTILFFYYINFCIFNFKLKRIWKLRLGSMTSRNSRSVLIRNHDRCEKEL